LVDLLSPLEASWKDAHSEEVLRLVNSLPQKSEYTPDDLAALLDDSFEAALTTVRLALDLSKDQFFAAFTEALGPGRGGIKAYKHDRNAFLTALDSLGAARSLTQLASAPVTWRDILVERLKSGRGSAIKGQARGRDLENFADRIVKRVFGDIGYDVRCRFIGSRGTSTEKADFAVPSKQDPRILIESKAYGATGSKQTDILGDMARIVEEKRHDTNLLLVTDGTTWKQRLNDLRKLVEMQNRGLITRIYTKRMESDLEADLRQLRRDHSL
jgi:hypothetical protein